MLLPCTFSIEEFLAEPRHRLLDAAAAETVASACHAADRNAVWVEGFSDAGKSCFADVLGRRLGWRVVHLDQLAFNDGTERSSYVAELDPSKLQDALGAAERRRHVVIEGICLRDVIESLADRRSALTVYIMRLGNPAGRLIWYDAADFNDGSARLNWVDRAAYEYHRRRRPQDDADLTLARIE